MGVPYAEVIGDPVDHSKSPVIHRFWLEKLGIEGDYRAFRCTSADLPRYIAMRCADPYWRGCNATAPLKEHAVRLVSDPGGICSRIGAANAIFRSPFGCGVGANTDIAGIAAALDDYAVTQRRACIIGAGGAARAAVEYLRSKGCSNVSIIVRDQAKAASLLQASAIDGDVHSFEESRAALAGAGPVINATPLGMENQPPMPRLLLDALDAAGAEALVFDMVYAPLETPLIARARDRGLETVGGLTMLIGQAAPAFELFFGAPAPRAHDVELRELLTS